MEHYVPGKKIPDILGNGINILNKMDKSLSVLEIGAGQGDVTYSTPQSQTSDPMLLRQ